MPKPSTPTNRKTSASTSTPQNSSSQESLYVVRDVLDQKGDKYLLAWEGIDPQTGKPWKPTWVESSPNGLRLIKRKRSLNQRIGSHLLLELVLVQSRSEVLPSLLKTEPLNLVCLDFIGMLIVSYTEKSIITPFNSDSPASWKARYSDIRIYPITSSTPYKN